MYTCCRDGGSICRLGLGRYPDTSSHASEPAWMVSDDLGEGVNTNMCIYIYIYIYTCMCVYIYIYIYTYKHK